MTDLLGAKIASPTRHAAIKCALIEMFAADTQRDLTRSAAAGNIRHAARR